MRRWIVGGSMALLLVMLVTAPVLATHGKDPVGGCPVGFELHDMNMPHDHGDHPHKHVGNDKDQNGDGWLCVKHAGPNGSIHVHIDNNVPLNQ